MTPITPETEVLLRLAWRETEDEDVQRQINGLLEAYGLTQELPEDTADKQLHRLKNNLAAIRKRLFIPYADQKRTMELLSHIWNTLFSAKLALNDWRLWYDSISKGDEEKGPIYEKALKVISEIESIPGMGGGMHATKELPPEQAALNKQVGEEIAAVKPPSVPKLLRSIAVDIENEWQSVQDWLEKGNDIQVAYFLNQMLDKLNKFKHALWELNK